jgi:hypothetical protein
MSHEVEQAKHWISKVHEDQLSNLYQVLENLREVEDHLQIRIEGVQDDLRRQERESINRMRGL